MPGTPDYNALAKQAGAVSSDPAPVPVPAGATFQPSAVPVPAGATFRPSVDYNALAKQAGAISSDPAPPPVKSSIDWNSNTPFFDPEGQIRAVPNSQVDAATASGKMKRAQIMAAPDGSKRYVPVDQVKSALGAGLTLADRTSEAIRNVPKPAAPAMQQDPLGEDQRLSDLADLGGEGSYSSKGQAAAATTAGVAASATLGLTASAPHVIAGAKAVGAWASANPVKAYLLYQVIKDLWPSGSSHAKAVGKLITDAAGE